MNSLPLILIIQSSATILILQFVIYTGSYIYILTDRLDFHLPLSYPLPYPLTSKGSVIQRKKIIQQKWKT